jgi:5-methylcytosine-specific restriction endonuclease McrA
MFGGNREKAIKRDGEKCVMCGMTRAEHKARYGRDITVDHIDKRGLNTPKAHKNNTLSNLQTMCLPCHAKKDISSGYELTNMKRNTYIEFNGRRQTLAQWSKELGFRHSLIQIRLKRGWSVEKALGPKLRLVRR